MAADTITTIAGLIDSEAVTVEFKTFGFFAITEYFFTAVEIIGFG